MTDVRNGDYVDELYLFASEESDGGLDLILTGDESQINGELKNNDSHNGKITLFPTTEVVDMTDKT